MTDSRLKSIVDRIERLKEEQKALGADVRDIFTEAKGNGYNPKVLRRIIAERAKDAAQVAEEEAELEAYRAALGMAISLVNSGVSLRKAAKAAGVSKSSIHRALAVPAASQTETQEVQPAGTASGTAVNEAAQPDAVAKNAAPQCHDPITPQPAPQGGEGAGTNHESCGGDEGERAQASDSPKRQVANGSAPNLMPVAPGPQDLQDDLAIPPSLRGPAPENRRLA